MPFLVPLILVLLAVLVATGHMALSVALWIGGGVIAVSVIFAILLWGFVIWAASRM